MSHRTHRSSRFVFISPSTSAPCSSPRLLTPFVVAHTPSGWCRIGGVAGAASRLCGVSKSVSLVHLACAHICVLCCSVVSSVSSASYRQTRPCHAKCFVGCARLGQLGLPPNVRKEGGITNQEMEKDRTNGSGFSSCYEEGRAKLGVVEYVQECQLRLSAQIPPCRPLFSRGVYSPMLLVVTVTILRPKGSRYAVIRVA